MFDIIERIMFIFCWGGFVLSFVFVFDSEFDFIRLWLKILEGDSEGDILENLLDILFIENRKNYKNI